MRDPDYLLPCGGASLQLALRFTDPIQFDYEVIRGWLVTEVERVG